MKLTKPVFNILVYGDQGVGKTMFAGTAMDHPDLGEVLFCNVEGGLMTVAGRRPKVVDIGFDKDGNSTNRVFDDLEEVAEAIASRKPGYEKVGTVVIDSGTELQARDLEFITKGDMSEWQDYGKNTTRMRRVFRRFRDLRVNVIITALVRRTEAEKDGKTKLVEVRPAFTKGVGESVMGFVDFVWFLYQDKETGERLMLTQPKGVTKAKTRGLAYSNLIGEIVKNPTIPDLYNKLREAVAKEGTAA
jgi:phage nucleotide-binding protein